jgi:hypothetical protein
MSSNNTCNDLETCLLDKSDVEKTEEDDAKGSICECVVDLSRIVHVVLEGLTMAIIVFLILQLMTILRQNDPSQECTKEDIVSILDMYGPMPYMLSFDQKSNQFLIEAAVESPEECKRLAKCFSAAQLVCVSMGEYMGLLRNSELSDETPLIVWPDIDATRHDYYDNYF